MRVPVSASWHDRVALGVRLLVDEVRDRDRRVPGASSRRQVPLWLRKTQRPTRVTGGVVLVDQGSSGLSNDFGVLPAGALRAGGDVDAGDVFAAAPGQEHPVAGDTAS